MAGDATQTPRFSILLPTHNRADVLPFAIRSVLWQTIQDFELLVVGDGCTDGTAKVVGGFRDPRVRWFDLPKAPHFGYANRNVALRGARGQYIAFMAHDDLWLPDHLELLAGCLEEPGADLAYSRPLWVAPDGTIAPSTYNLHRPETLEGFLARGGHSIPTGCVVHRRACFARCGYWDETLTCAGDQDMWARIIEAGGRRNFVYLPMPTCLHFRAIWKTEANAGPVELQVWKGLHALDGFMPAALRIAVPPGMTEQEAAWRAMAPDAAKWTRELRSAVWEALDRRLSQSDELVVQLLRRPAWTEASPRGLIEDGREFVTELNQAQRSLAWKVVRRLRRLRSHAAPPGTARARAWIRMSRALARIV